MFTGRIGGLIDGPGPLGPTGRDVYSQESDTSAGEDRGDFPTELPFLESTATLVRDVEMLIEEDEVGTADLGV